MSTFEQSANGNGSLQEEIVGNLGIADMDLDTVMAKADEIIQQAKEITETTVRKYPVRSALVCLGVGYLIGRGLFSKR